MSPWIKGAIAFARVWVGLYSIGLPFEVRETRRLEIDSDLWEHDHDARGAGTPAFVAAIEIVLRVLMGVADDVSWRSEAIQTRSGADPDRRVPFMALAPAKIRWLGLAGGVGGVLWAATFIVPLDPGAMVRSYGHIVLSILLIAGLAGFYADQRERATKTGRLGFALVLASFTAWLGLNMLGTVFGISDQTTAMNVLAAMWVFLLPPGFILLGLGLDGGARAVPLAVGFVFIAWLVVPRTLYAHYFPSVTNWNRGDTPPGLAVFFLMGIGVALMGFSAFRNAASTPGHSESAVNTIGSSSWLPWKAKSTSRPA